jgi:antitoxin (DNA-binding transcriptional repressor) of toxin-antitoxin stability system
MMAMFAHHGGMNEAAALPDGDDAVVLGVRDARDRFSDLVMRAAAAGDITRISRGRSHRTVAAIVPIEILEEYEAMLDAQDARIAQERLADIDAGYETTRPAADVFTDLGL